MPLLILSIMVIKKWVKISPSAHPKQCLMDILKILTICDPLFYMQQNTVITRILYIICTAKIKQWHTLPTGINKEQYPMDTITTTMQWCSGLYDISHTQYKPVLSTNRVKSMHHQTLFLKSEIHMMGLWLHSKTYQQKWCITMWQCNTECLGIWNTMQDLKTFVTKWRQMFQSYVYPPNNESYSYNPVITMDYYG